MARTAKARILRSTRTAPNVSPTADLTTAFGTTANATTSAAYATGGVITWKRWVPGSATATNQDPATVTTASVDAWRDTTAENAAEQVRYAAGTWTVRVRLTKTGQTVAADITVRVTVIVYRVTSAGAHVSEIGRATTADTVLSTATLTLSPSFTTGTAVTFNAGDKVQVEAYVTPITANLPAAPAAAVNVNFVVDETSANSGASFTAQPAYDIVYARAQAVTAIGTAAMTRKITAFRSFPVTVIGTSAAAKAVRPLPKAVTAIGTAVLRRTISPIPKAVTATGTAANPRKAIATGPKTVTVIGTAAMTRRVTAAKLFSTAAIGIAGFGRALVFGRHFPVTATGVPSGRADMPISALNRIIPAPAGDWPLNTPTKVIAGVTRNSAGAVVPSATVKLVRQSDDVRVASTTSHSVTGAYSFTRGGDDPNTYRVVAVKAGAPEIHGVSDELVPS